MSPRPPRSSVDALPATVPIFPLAGVLLLPHMQLPLNIFEPRYLAMTRDAMQGHRVIGMVQPIDPQKEGEDAPAVYTTGCAGRITAFEETDDGRYLITLTAICRFAITGELPLIDPGYRRARVTYDKYSGDLQGSAHDSVDRVPLLDALKACLPSDNACVDWQAIERMTSDRLVTSLAISLPLAPSEKQALLEAPGTEDRAQILITLMTMMAATCDVGCTEARIQ